jgi:hypothetical protein
LVAAQPGSGRTVAEFCATRDVGPAGFYAWRKRLLTEPGPAPKRRARAAAAGFAEPQRAAGFAAVRVTTDARPAATPAAQAAERHAAATVEVVLPGGTALRAPMGCDAEWLAGLAAALRRHEDAAGLRERGPRC